MRLWNIVNGSFEYEIEVGDSTTLSGQHLSWHQLIQAIDDYFNSKHSRVQIFEDGQPLNKNDWQCFYIPFDARIQLDKITSKSPLKEVQSAASEQLAYSPLFQELQEVWEQLDVDLQVLNEELNQWGIISSLMPLGEKKITDFITFKPKNSSLSPIEVKKLLLRIFLKRTFDKKTLIIVELPEIYASDDDLTEFMEMMNKSSSKGYKFLLVTQKLHIGSVNYLWGNKIINQAILEHMKWKIINELPFYCPEEMYDQAKELILDHVDNFNLNQSLQTLSTPDSELLVTIIRLIMYNLNIDQNIDTQGLEPYLKKFLSQYD